MPGPIESGMKGTDMKTFVLLALAALPAFAQGAAKGKTEVTWYGHAAFVVKTPGGTTLAIDPWITNPANQDPTALGKIQKLDYILVSHGHSDHVGDTIPLQKKTNAKIVAAYELGGQLVAAGVPVRMGKVPKCIGTALFAPTSCAASAASRGSMVK